MLQVKTLLLPSPIHGTGVFAAEDISAGAIVWQFDPERDLVLPRDLGAGEGVARYLAHFAYFDSGRNGFVLCGDNAKWMNHSDTTNTRAVFEEGGFVYDRDVAVRDIAAGEEITCDYRAFAKP